MDEWEELLAAHGAHYAVVEEAVMQRIERRVLGASYGASSYTTRDQADRLVGLLDLEPESRLLDVGSGAGWPGIYLAAASGAEVVLSDIPPEGLSVASRRLRIDGLDGRVVAASGEALPFADQSFDAATSSDVLC